MTTARFRPKTMATSCEGAQEAISARLDGERHPVLGAALDLHLSSCPGCRKFESEILDLGRRAGLRAPRAVPEDLMATLAPLVLSGPRPPDLFNPLPRVRGRVRGGRPGWARRAQWAGAMAPAVLACLALPLGLVAHPRLVPTRPPSPCTVGLTARHTSGEG